MEALEILRKAYDDLDVSLLKQAVGMGVDVNQGDESDESWFEHTIWCYGSACDYDRTDFEQIKVKMMDFSRELVANGLNLNRYYDDFGEIVTTFESVARWSRHPKLLEYLLQNGMNPNFMIGKERRSPYDNLDEDIFAEECCGYYDCACDLYNMCRLAVAYGAKPIELLKPGGSPEVNAICDLGMKLDSAGIAKLDAKSIIDCKLSHECTYYSKFEYGYDFYYNPEKYEERVISALSVIIEKTGIESIDDNCLDDCVDGQLVNVLEYLLKKGADPNVNCFTESYKWVKSSALYELDKRGSYYSQQKKERMTELLLNAGAKIK